MEDKSLKIFQPFNPRVRSNFLGTVTCNLKAYLQKVPTNEKERGSTGRGEGDFSPGLLKIFRLEAIIVSLDVICTPRCILRSPNCSFPKRTRDLPFNLTVSWLSSVTALTAMKVDALCWTRCCEWSTPECRLLIGCRAERSSEPSVQGLALNRRTSPGATSRNSFGPARPKQRSALVRMKSKTVKRSISEDFLVSTWRLYVQACS